MTENEDIARLTAGLPERVRTTAANSYAAQVAVAMHMEASQRAAARIIEVAESSRTLDDDERHEIVKQAQIIAGGI